MPTFNDRAGNWIGNLAGSMWTFWFVLTVLISWMAGMELFHGPDGYPFAFLLFLGNCVQLLLMFVLAYLGNRQQAHLEAILASQQTMLAAQQAMLARQDTLLEHMQLVLNHLMEEQNVELAQLGIAPVSGDPLTGN